MYNLGSPGEEEVTCKICGDKSIEISKALGVCGNCLRMGNGLEFARRAHEESRRKFNLPIQPPKDPDGVSCGLH